MEKPFNIGDEYRKKKDPPEIEELEEHMTPFERVMYENRLNSIEDFKINFFDEDEVKEKKKKIWDSLNEHEKRIINEKLLEMEENTKEMREITDAEILDVMPSIFSTVEDYTQARNEVLKIAPQYESKIPPVDNINLLEPKKITTQGISSGTMFYPVERNQFRVGDFFYSDGELCYQNKEMQHPHVIGNFWISILEEINTMTEICNEQNVSVDYAEETTWKIEIFCMGKTYETEQCVKNLLSDSQVLKCTKDRAYLESDKESKRLYKKYINVLIGQGEYETVKLYQSTGWTNVKGVGWVYVTDKGMIGFNDRRIRANVPYRFEFDPNKINTLQNFGDFWEMREICKKKQYSIFLLHFSCTAVMTTLFQMSGRPVNFIVALIGATNSQKTAVGAVFSRLFDRTTMASSDIRFNSTEVAILEKLEKYGDAILMVDDFVPYTSMKNAREQQKKLETIIRSYGDREPRKRSHVFAKINSVSEYSPIKGCCLITGEIFRTESVSSDTRVIQIPFERGSVDLTKLTFYQENPLIYPSFFVGFIEFLQKNLVKIIQFIADQVKVIRENHPAEICTPRFVDALAILSAETKVFYAYARKAGFMSQQDADLYSTEDIEMIQKVIADNEKNIKTKTPATEICLALKWAMKSEKLKLIDKEDMSDLREYSGIVGEDANFYFILPDTLWRICKEYSCFTNTEVRYRSGRELNLPLKHENLILIKEEGSNQQPRSTHKIGNFTGKRFFYIFKKEFHKMCELYEQF